MTEENSASGTAPRNPYLVGLVVITLTTVAVAVVLYVLAAQQSNYGSDGSESLLSVIVAANSWLGFAGMSLLATLIVAGLRWGPTPLPHPVEHEQDPEQI